MVTVRFISGPDWHECFGSVCIVTPDDEPPPVRFLSGLDLIAERESRAGHDADAARTDRFPAGAGE